MKAKLFILSAAIIFLIAGSAAFANPAVTTDAPDYPPGSTATITGSGFQPGEIVQLQVANVTDSSDVGPEHDPWTVNADENGNFTTTWYVTVDEAGMSLQLTATGLTSGLTAGASFADSSNVKTVTVGAASGVATYGTSQSITYTVTIVAAGNGSGSTTPSVTGLPASITAVFNHPVIDLQAVNNNQNSTTNITLTLTTAATTPVLTNSFSVNASSVIGNGTLSIQSRAITVTAQPNTKTYDGTTSSATAPTITSGTLAAGDTAILTEIYSNQNAGTNKSLIPAVTITNLTSASATTNYSITFVTNSAGIISSKTLTPTVTLNNKVYDGTTAATTIASRSLSGIVGSDDVNLGTSGIVAAFSSKNVGSYTPGVTGLSLTGTTAGNYQLSTTSVNSGASITARPITITAGANSKIYDGTTSASATPTLTSGTLASSESATYSETYNDQNVGSGKTLTPTAIIKDSGNVDVTANYSVTASSVTTGIISAKTLTTTGLTANNKVYNSTTAATLSGTAALQSSETAGTGTTNDGKPYSGDTVSVTGTPTGTFASASVGTGINVSVSGLSLTGGAAGNYTLTQPTLTANITKASTTSAVVSSLNPALPSSNVTFTVTLSVVSPGAGTPTGSVQFKTNGAAFGAPVSLSGLSAATTILGSALAHGSNSITAEYAGDGNFFGITNNLSPKQVINRPPVAGTHSLGTTVNSNVVIAASTLSSLDFDADGDALSIIAVSATSTNGGTVTLSGGTLTYSPQNNFAGGDQFTYTVSDSFGATNTSKVNVTIRLAGSATSVINNVAPQAGGNFKLVGYGIPGNSYLIQATTNMINWDTLATNTAFANGLILYTDLNAHLYVSRYYRLKVP